MLSLRFLDTYQWVLAFSPFLGCPTKALSGCNGNVSIFDKFAEWDGMSHPAPTRSLILIHSGSVVYTHPSDTIFIHKI